MRLITRHWPWFFLALMACTALLIQSRKEPLVRDGNRGRGISFGENAKPEKPWSPRGKESDRTDIERFGSAIDDAAAALRDCQSANDAAITLDQLAGVLGAGDPEVVASAVRAFFASGDDVATGMPFTVAADGRLDSWPTLRTFLLEALPTVEPEVALAISREVMDRMTSPEEYTIALRNLAWSDLNGDLAPEFGARFERLLRMTEWRAQPGSAYLESIDAALLLPPRRAVGLLVVTDAEATTSPDLARACFIALDHIAERDPRILTEIETSRLEPDQRASLFARLDLADKAQRECFAAYLNSLPEGAELDYFAALFPNGNHLQGNRLFSTPIKPPSIAERRENDRRTLRELSAMNFRSGTPAADAVGKIASRLRGWLAAPE